MGLPSNTDEHQTNNEVSMNQVTHVTTNETNHEEPGTGGKSDFIRTDDGDVNGQMIHNNQHIGGDYSPPIDTIGKDLLDPKVEIYELGESSLQTEAKQAKDVENAYTTVQKKRGRKKKVANKISL